MIFLKKTNKQFLSEVSDLVKNEYSALETYVDYSTKILFQHNTCNHKYYIKPSYFLKGYNKCPMCYKKNKDHDVFIEELLKINSNILIKGYYISNKIKILYECKLCGNTYSATPSSLLIGGGCVCNKNKKISDALKKTHEQFISEVYALVESEYLILGEYNNSQIKILIKHNIQECGHKYEATPNNFLRGNRCPICHLSKGEYQISKILKQYRIDYTAEFLFDDCKNILKLPFDFVIHKNGQLYALIEFDGEQHYKKTGWSKPGDKLKRTMINDKIKDEYCKNNNISLLRIPYFELKNINKILNTWLTDINLIGGAMHDYVTDRS